MGRPGRRVALVIGLIGLGAFAAGAVGTQVARHGALDPDPATVAQGRGLYAQHCAACHGARLEGQPDWQTVSAEGKVRAPPHDASGHSWQHTDDELLHLTKFGLRDVAPPGYVSDMPAFERTLTDPEIAAVLAFIKHEWPRDIRAYQAMLSHPSAETAAALGTEWRFPPTCDPSVRLRSVPRRSAAPVEAR